MKTSTYTRFRRLAHSAAHSAALVLAAALLATALLATACTDPADGSPASTDALSFGASLLAPGNSGKHTADTRTRATAPVTKDAFTKGDRIAVSIDNQVKPYVYGTDLRFTATDPDNSFYWTPGQQQQDGVIAWYPYSDELPSLSSPLNISRQDTDAEFAAADFLFAGPATLTRNPSSALTFSHRTALLRLNIKADGKTVVPTLGFDVTGVDVKGTPVDATIDPTDGTLTGIGNTAVIHTHRCAATPDGYTATYEAQIIPHTILSGGTSLTIHTTNPDKAYIGIILSGSYEAGHIHTYNITLGNDRVSITPTDKDLSWNDGDIRPGLPPTGYDLTVSTAKELKDFADAVNNDHTIGTSSVEARSARVLQTADIDLTGIDDWTPIGNRVSPSYNSFQGSYNGNGYTISNLKIKSGEQYKGLFGDVSGTSSSTPAVLTGIHLRNVDIDVSHNSNISCGAIAGSISSKAVITFCSAQGEIKTDMNQQSYNNNNSGGITGNNSGTISYCRADVKVTASSDANNTGAECNAGGIAGTNTGTILACEASGSEVSAKAYGAKAQAGGIAGTTSGGSYTASCASEVGKIIANTNGQEAYAGGVVGYKYGVLYSSYARGDATAGAPLNMAGAIVGYNNSGDTDLCIGTGAGAGTGGQGTSNLPPSPGSILYDADATDEEIYNLMQSKDFEKQDIPTTTYDATCFPAYGIEVKEVTFASHSAWSYDPASGKIRIRGLPSVTPP